MRSAEDNEYANLTYKWGLSAEDSEYANLTPIRENREIVSGKPSGQEDIFKK